MDIIDGVIGLSVACILIVSVAVPIISSQAATLTGINATILNNSITLLIVVVLVLAASLMKRK